MCSQSPKDKMLKIGIGEDIHRLEEGLPLWIGGVLIPSSFGAVAHSDGDVLIHALIDALVSPVYGTDIGALFPDNDPTYKNISGTELLRKTTAVFEKSEDKVKIYNIDAVVTLDKPKIREFIPHMRERIAEILDINPAQIGIKGKTSERTAPERIEAKVVVLLDCAESF